MADSTYSWYSSITPVMSGWVVVVNTVVLFVQAGAIVRLYSTVYCDCLTCTVQGCPQDCTVCPTPCYSSTEETIVESVKSKSNMMNTWLMGVFIGFTCFCVGYALVVTVSNCRQNKGQYVCNQ